MTASYQLVTFPPASFPSHLKHLQKARNHLIHGIMLDGQLHAIHQRASVSYEPNTGGTYEAPRTRSFGIASHDHKSDKEDNPINEDTDAGKACNKKKNNSSMYRIRGDLKTGYISIT